MAGLVGLVLNIPSAERLKAVQERVAACRLCPRLVSYRETLPPRASFLQQEYWRKPVPGFGDPDAWLLIIGLAPAAHGGNRTGRVFTGDESGRFLMSVLHRAGLASSPLSVHRDDGLCLNGCYISASVRCVPPQNKPTKDEISMCAQYLDDELDLLEKLEAVVVLGRLAFGTFLDYARRRGARVPKIEFAHSSVYEIPGLPKLYSAYHPSPRNTYTGRLSDRMLFEVFERAIMDRSSRKRRDSMTFEGRLIGRPSN